jgi:FKBP-type peptidyl-prolyl cis-trans isomerase
MKKTFFLFATAILVTFSACNNFKTTAVLSSETDSLNYAYGLGTGASFVRYFKADTTKANYEAFLKGFKQGFDSVSDTEIEKTNAILSGISFKENYKDGYLKDRGRVIDSSFVANKKLIEKTVFDILAGKDSIIGFDARTAQQYMYKLYAQQSDSVKQKLTAEQLDSLNIAFAVAQSSGIIANVPDSTKADFIKNFKKGLKFTSAAKKYNTLGFISAIQLYKGLLTADTSVLIFKPEIMITGVNAGLLNDHTIFTSENAADYFNKHIINRMFGKNKTEGEQFLSENGKREGIQVTASGLQYEVIREGKGVKPTVQDTVKVNYEGMLLDSTIFDSSYQRGEPFSFSVNGVIPGWKEGLQLMSVGSEYKFYIPYFLGYGEHGNQNPMTGQFSIEPYETLIFKVELLGVKKFVPQANIQNQSLIH